MTPWRKNASQYRFTASHVHVWSLFCKHILSFFSRPNRAEQMSCLIWEVQKLLRDNDLTWFKISPKLFFDAFPHTQINCSLLRRGLPFRGNIITIFALAKNFLHFLQSYSSPPFAHKENSSRPLLDKTWDPFFFKNCEDSAYTWWICFQKYLIQSIQRIRLFTNNHTSVTFYVVLVQFPDLYSCTSNK